MKKLLHYVLPRLVAAHVTGVLCLDTDIIDIQPRYTYPLAISGPWNGISVADQ